MLVLDCDHVPYPHMLERLLPEFVDPRVAYVQSPQYYANSGVNRLAGAAWSQQALFFGPIARGKDAHRLDDLLRHERDVPPHARSRRSAASRRTR